MAPKDFTYDLSTDVGKVRFEIGDTVQEKMLLSDTEISYALSVEGSALRAAARLAESLAARFVSVDNMRVVTAQWSQANIYKKYSDLATRLRARATASSPGGIICPSVSRDEKSANELDSDTVQPKFKKDMFRNPDTDSFDSGSID